MYSNGAGRIGCNNSVCERMVGRVPGWKKQKNWWNVGEDTAERTFDEELIIIQEWWNTYRSLLGNEIE